MIKNEILAPCPFCGGDARDRRKVKGAYLDVYIQCRRCGAKSGAVNGCAPYNELLAEAVRIWNERRLPNA